MSSSRQEQFDRENIVMRVTGLRRHEVRKMDRDDFERVYSRAVSGQKKFKIRGAKYEDADARAKAFMDERSARRRAEEKAREQSLMDQLREAQPSDAGKPLPGVPSALEQPVAPRPETPVSEKVSPADIEDIAESAQPPSPVEPGEGELPEGSNGDILINVAGEWVVLSNPGSGKFVLVHEGDLPYWKSLTPCDEE